MNTTATAPAIEIPTIFTANTYFWGSNSGANSRRNAENRRQDEAANFFTAIGMEVSRSGDTVTAEGHNLFIEFSYSESCKNVYKTLRIYRNGKKSNISSLRKLIEQ